MLYYNYHFISIIMLYCIVLASPESSPAEPLVPGARVNNTTANHSHNNWDIMM